MFFEESRYEYRRIPFHDRCLLIGRHGLFDFSFFDSLLDIVLIEYYSLQLAEEIVKATTTWT